MSPQTGLCLALYFAGASLILAALLTPVCMKLARSFGAVDIPRERSLHAHPIPLMGGVAIAGALSLIAWSHMAGAALFSNRPVFLDAFIEDLQGSLTEWPANGFRLGVVCFGGALIACVGLLDDLRGLTVRQRIYPQFAIATAVVALGVRPELDFLPGWMSFVVAVVWLVGITNAFNLIDGADGLASGLGAIAAFLLGTTMLLTGHPASASLFFAIGGACLGFLIFNWHPAVVFMGSAGSLFLGYTLGATTMVATFLDKNTVWLFPLLIPVLAFAVPLYDTLSVILIRVGLRQSPFVGDKRHFHHRLMQIGFSHRQTVVFLWLVGAGLGAGAMLIPLLGIAGNLIVFAQAVVMICVILLIERVANRVREQEQKREKAEAPRAVAA